MKILLVISDYPSDNKFVNAIAKHLAGDKDNEVHALCGITQSLEPLDNITFENVVPSNFSDADIKPFEWADVVITLGAAENYAYNKAFIAVKKPLVVIAQSDKIKSIALYNMEVGFIYPSNAVKDGLSYLQKGIVVELPKKEGDASVKALKSLDTWLTKFIKDAKATA